jgi:nicotinate-nucleotide pyrophosphorylase (carboxylating)
MDFFEVGLSEDFRRFFSEDDLQGNFYYLTKLPNEEIECSLKIKSDVLLSGLPYLVGAFNFLGAKLSMFEFENFEGKNFKQGEVIKFNLPFNIALTGERVALNLVQQSTRISTFTQAFVSIAEKKNIKILDTRKTTPGLRSLEKYAVRVGGAYNHRMSQCDVFMIKDNHKTIFGSLEKAFHYFKSMQTFYNSLVVEIHSEAELKEAISLGIKHVMLDNFSPEAVQKAIAFKKPGMTYELSGGLNLKTLEHYLIDGVDALSIGALTHSAPHVDLSLKMKKLN